MFLFGNLSQLEVDKEGINWLVYNLSGKTMFPIF